MPKGAQGEANIESIGGKGAMVKVAIDKLKDSKRSDDELKDMAIDGEAKEEHVLKSKDRDRARDRERNRTKSRDRDRGHRSRERAKDSGVLTDFLCLCFFFSFVFDLN